MARKSPSIGNTDPAILRSAERVAAQENAMISRTGKPVSGLVSDMISRAKYNFTPVVGSVYHLYNAGSEYVLSPIKFEKVPGLQFLGSYRLATSDIWEQA